MIRNWNRQTDSGAIHAIGDGSVVVYGFGPEIKQVLAYPLSADSFCEIRLPSVDACTSERLDGTAIWTHTLENGDRIIDMVDVGTHCFRRQVETADNLEMLLDIESVFSLVAEESTETTLVFEAKNGVLTRLTPDRAIAVVELAEELRGETRRLLVLGDGGRLCRDGLAQLGVESELAPAQLLYQNAVGVGLAAEHGTPVSAQELAPVYLRISQAERERNARLQQEATQK